MALFKYTSTKLLPHLSGCTLRFTPQKEFNDPFDSVPDTEALMRSPAYQKFLEAYAETALGKTTGDAQEMEGAKIALEMISKIAKALYIERIVADLDNFRILCLTRAAPHSPGAALMWGHYAQDARTPHAGLALEFDETDPWFATHTGRADRLYESVEYRSVRPSLITDLRRVFMVKSKLWQYEEEVRLVRYVGNDANDLIDPKMTVAKYPESMLKAVYVGICAKPSLADDVRVELAKNSKLAHVKVRRVVAISPDDFRFEIAD